MTSLLVESMNLGSITQSSENCDKRNSKLIQWNQKNHYHDYVWSHSWCGSSLIMARKTFRLQTPTEKIYLKRIQITMKKIMKGCVFCTGMFRYMLWAKDKKKMSDLQCHTNHSYINFVFSKNTKKTRYPIIYGNSCSL